MSRFRSLVRKISKPAAMAIVAGSLAVSLTVTTTQKAEANPIAALPVIAAAESIVGGASLPLVLPSMAATVAAVTPVGWVMLGTVALAGLIIGAYATKDYWLPYVNGTFGSPQPNTNTEAPPGTAQIDPKVRLSGLTQSNGLVTITGTTEPAPSSTSVVFAVSVRLKCNSAANGSGTAQPDKLVAPYSNYNNTSNRNWTLSASCSAGYPVGAIAGARNADPLLVAEGPANGGYPANVMRWGTLVTSSSGFNPNGSDVKYKTTVECVDDNGSKSMLSADWLGSDGAAKFPSCEAAGKGHGTGVNKIEGYAPSAPGTPGTVPQTIWSTASPAVDPNYQQCDQTKPGPGCEMRITIDGKPCVIGQWECVNWTQLYNDPATAPRVGCTYGPYTLSPSACSIMEPAYRPGGAPATQENTDGNPSTRNNVDLGGQPFTPEITKPATVPGVGGAPTPGMDPSAGECFPTGWAMFNPVEWVLKPVGCALQAAFVPKTQTVTEATTRIQNKVNTVGFATVSNAWLGTFNAAGGGSGCSGPTINFDMRGVHQTLQPFQACTQPMATVAGVANAVSALMIVLFGGLGVVRAIATAFGFNFSLGKSAGDSE